MPEAVDARSDKTVAASMYCSKVVQKALMYGQPMFMATVIVLIAPIIHISATRAVVGRSRAACVSKYGQVAC
jgi:hypothetical protein